MRNINIHPRRQAAHYFRRRGYFIYGLTLHAQADQESPDLRQRCFTGHDLLHDRAHVIPGQIVSFRHCFDGLLDIHGNLPAKS